MVQSAEYSKFKKYLNFQIYNLFSYKTKCCQITAIFLTIFGLKEKADSPDSAEKQKELFGATFKLVTSLVTVLSIFAFIVEILKLNYQNILKQKSKLIVNRINSSIC